MEFSYRYSGRYRILLPMIPVKITTKQGRVLDTDAYVDSGAAFNFFGSESAKWLDLEMDAGRAAFMTGGDGAALSCVMHPVRLEISGRTLETEVGFSPDLHVGLNILGLKGFFDHFSEVAIRHREHRVILRD